MRRIALMLIAAAALGTNSARADWSGLYFGGYVGGTWGTTDVSRLDNAFPPVQSKPNGVALGGLFGYNFQSGPYVFGLEADAGWLSAKATTNAFTTVAFTQTSKI